MIRCVLFDLDGTLLDTAPDLGHALNRLLEEEGRQPLEQKVIRPEASNGARGLLRLGFGLKPGDARYDSMRQRYLSHYSKHLARETRPFEGVSTLLQALPGRGLTWGIVTNKPRGLTEPLLNRIALPGSPCCVVSGDSAAQPKPHPAPVLLACEQAGLAPSECVYVGDAYRDIEAGRRAGTYTIAARYGYIDPGDDPFKWRADSVIGQPGELLDWLDQLPQGADAQDGRDHFQH